MADVGANESYNGCATQMGYNGYYWVVPQLTSVSSKAEMQGPAEVCYTPMSSIQARFHHGLLRDCAVRYCRGIRTQHFFATLFLYVRSTFLLHSFLTGGGLLNRGKRSYPMSLKSLLGVSNTFRYYIPRPYLGHGSVHQG